MKIQFHIFLLFLVVHCSHASGKKVDDSLQVDRASSYRFAVISDLNGSYGSKTYAREVAGAVDYIKDASRNIDFVLSTGDMVAGQKKGLDYKGMWKAFHTVVTDPLQQHGVSIFPSPGNHDAYISRQTERRHYNDTWKTKMQSGFPKDFRWVSGVVQNAPFQYAFKVGPALFISVDNTDVRPWTNDSLKWLEEVLTIEKQASPKIVFGHVPMLPFAFKKETEYFSNGSKTFLTKLETLFETHKVDAFLSGHSHVYYPGSRDSYTQYISVPLLGGGPRYLLTRGPVQSRSPKGFLIFDYDDQGQWSFKSIKSSGFSEVSSTSLPESIRIPSSNSKLCRKCSSFPRSHFLEADKRLIYRRHDL